MFNGNLIARLIKEQRKQVGDMVAYVFGGNSHISKTYFKNRTSIDSKYLEKLSAFFKCLFRTSSSLTKNLRIENHKQMYITSPTLRSISIQAQMF